MAISKRFIVKKEAASDVITYCEYEKLKGYNVKPKEGVSFEDMINVDKMIIINPSLIEKLVSKKCSRNLEKILNMMTLIYDDDSDDTGVGLVLDEVEKFKTILMNRYRDYMKKEQYNLYLKKLEIIKSELELRRQVLYENAYLNEKGKKSR